jgi:UDP-N-acetylmuramate--alanine ligase
MVVDDYGHHPTEIAAVIAAARAGIDRRVVVVFQPHRYSRTQQLMDEFGASLSGADVVVLTDIYAAGEPPIEGVTLEALANVVRSSARNQVHVVPALDRLPETVAGIVQPGDLVITLGAGSIGTVGERILETIRNRRAEPAANGGRR